MAQVYLLSVAANLFCSLLLSSGLWGRKVAVPAGFKELMERKKTAVPIGLATTIIGVLKLIVRSPGETIPVAGDLLPALYGIFLGLLLVAGAFPKSALNGEEAAAVPRWGVLSYKMPLGVIGVVITLLHFIIPGVVIL